MEESGGGLVWDAVALACSTNEYHKNVIHDI
jgi:hypothetical protein